MSSDQQPDEDSLGRAIGTPPIDCARKTTRRCPVVATISALAIFVPAEILAVAVEAPDAKSSPSTTAIAHLQLSRISEPPELKSAPFQPVVVQSEIVRKFATSKTIPVVDPKHPETIAPALREVNDLLKQDSPISADLYFLRATLSCFAGAPSAAIIDDVQRSIDRYNSALSASKTLQDHYSLKAKVEFQAGQYGPAMGDLDKAIAQDYFRADNAFNDGKTEPSVAPRQCYWSLSDFDALSRQFPSDGRPALYRALYLEFFDQFHLDADYSRILSAFDQAATLSPRSPLPHYFAGRLYVQGTIGGMISSASAACLDYEVPRTEACQKLDELHRKGIRELTAAIAIEPGFAPAYEARAAGLFKIKSYRQAVRDYDKSLELEKIGLERAFIYGDRARAKMQLGLTRNAIEDLTKAIELRCGFRRVGPNCDEYEDRAGAYTKVADYTHAIQDYTAEITQYLTTAYLMGIEQFRRLYPEYDSVSDDVLCDLLRRRFYPQMSYEDFSKQFLITAGGFNEFILADLYIKRGDIYMRLQQQTLARSDYARAFVMSPDTAKVYFDQIGDTTVRNGQQPL